MQRTLNYTGRNKIEQKQALFSFNGSGKPPEFNVIFNIDPSQYSSDASLYVEAYYKETRQRFNFGSVTKIRPPSNRTLDQIDLSGPTSFRVLIVDETGRHGQLLASGDRFRADTDDDDRNRSSILAVKKYALGQLTWKVHFETGAAPELHLNDQIHNAIEKMRTDPVFQSLILPAALREVLFYYLWNDEDVDDNENCARWMAFASLFAEGRPESGDPIEQIQWVEEVVAAFSNRFHLTDILLNAGEGGK